ncbi:EmrB/QacA subfamily drug resistance transporter [Kitasatospora sp. MAA19]|uniref:MFS transporter n=1 Tax=unclassified Kitasatospora TaxID=2633591 RepID=UPI002473BBE0|nr:MFS transporter [Kitasatospora sp. MAA19]MDH6707855.1 EmrB/QacA subfamily drug resistance transporter [Kitasatospora sp. MAA19]
MTAQPSRRIPDGPPPSASAVSGRAAARRWRALAVCLVAGFMTLLDVSIVNVALPTVRAGLHMSDSGLQWVLSGYALAFGLVLVPAGRLGDARSRRTVFLTGLALFTLASALAGAARNQDWLVLARLFQGAAGGVLVPQVSGFIQVLFQGAERGRAFGALGATVGLSTAVGPLLGGLLIHLFGPHDGWRWVFYVNLPIGVAALPLAYRLLPAPQAAARAGHRDFDPVGMLLLGSGTVAVLLPFVQEQQWHSAARWLLLPLAAVLLAAFVGWERYYARHREPLVSMGLFAVRPYAAGVTLSLVYFAGFTAIFFIFTLYLQTGLHYSALAAGVAVTPFALGSAVAAAVGGRLVGRLGRRLVLAGLLLVLLGLLTSALAVQQWPGQSVAWATALPLLVAGVGSGLVISPNQTLTLQQVPVARAGSAGGVLQTAQRVGSAVGIAVVGSVFFAHAQGPRPDWAWAFQLGVAVAAGLVLAALLVAVADVAAGWHGD